MNDDGAYDDRLSLGEWLRAIVRAHWLLVGSLAANAVLLLFVHDVWVKQFEGSGGRSGRSFHGPLGERDLWLCGIGVVLYLLAGVGAPRHWAMKPPTEGEITIARWLVRAIALVIVWFAFAVTIP